MMRHWILRSIFILLAIVVSAVHARTIGYTSIERTEGFTEAQIEQLNERIFSRLVDSGYLLTNIGALPRTASESETAKVLGKTLGLDMLFVQTLTRGETYDYTYRLFGATLGELVAEKTFSFTDFKTQFPPVLSDIRKRLSVDLDFDMPAVVSLDQGGVKKRPLLDKDANSVGTKMALSGMADASGAPAHTSVPKDLFSPERAVVQGRMNATFITAVISFAVAAVGLSAYYGLRSQMPNIASAENAMLISAGGACTVGIINLCIAIPSYAAYNDTNRFLNPAAR